MLSILKRFFCLALCLTVFTSAFTAVAPAAQNPPVMQAPSLPPASATSAPTPAVPVPASTAPVKSPAASATTPAVPAPSSNYEKEFNELYQKLNQIATIKKELKQHLNEIEGKLDSARQLAIESKETSFKIIQQSQTSDAENLVAQLDKNLQSLTETQKKLNNVDLPKFEDNVKKIQELMQLIQTKMDELASKGLKLQISQAQLELQKQKSLQGVVPAKGEAPQATATKPQTEEKTFTRKIYDFTADSVATGISATKRVWKNFKQWVYSKPEESVEGKKNSKSIDLSSQASIRKMIDELDSMLKQFDEIQISMLQKYANIKSKAKNLEIVLKSNDEIRKYFERLDEENPTWKEAAVNVFSSVIDGVYVICKAIKKTAHMFYDKFLKGFVNDVKAKIHEQEKQADKPIEAQSKEPVAAAPAMQEPAVAK